MAAPCPAELARLFGAPIELASEPCIHGVETLYDEETPFVARAVSKRQREFASARVCARRLLARIGIPPCPIVPDVDRCPQWPTGVVGSISHTRHVCLVAVASDRVCRSVGVDIEPHDGIDLELMRTICRDEERAWLATHPTDAQRVWARRFFCAKEAFYKAQFPLTRHKLGFHDVVVDFGRQADALGDVEFGATVVGNAAVEFAAANASHNVPLQSAGKLVNGSAYILAGVAYLS